MPSIRHIVVLMLENRSFDHMLGFLGRGDGLTGTEFNRVDPANPASEQIPVSNDARYLGDFGDPPVDPSHAHTHVNVQMFNADREPSPLPPETMIGFVKDYASLEGQPPAAGRQIMKCFDPAKLPALSTLAREFVLCDRWFSSLPGQTWPNRFFVHCATSGGFLDNQLHDFRNMRTIYDNLTEAGHDWTVFFHDIPQCAVLDSLRNPAFKQNFKTFAPFFKIACETNTLPVYSFIEPRYFDFLGLKANDQHPPHDVSLGEHLIADVYDAIRNSPAWPHTLLVVTWDEHGGLFDHVLPPTTVSPDGLESSDPVFDFKRLGVRVPSVIVSPFTEAGVIDSTVYDHASVPATLKEMLDLPAFLTARDRDAKTFTRNLTETMRTNTPAHLPRPPQPAGAAAAPATAAAMGDEDVFASLDQAQTRLMSEFQESLVALSKDLELAESQSEHVARMADLPDDEHDGAVAVRTAFERYLHGGSPSSAQPRGAAPRRRIPWATRLDAKRRRTR
jgi:phospholipase C